MAGCAYPGSSDDGELFAPFRQAYAFAPESRGFIVETDLGALGGNAAVNLELLRRAFDSLHADPIKYTRPSEPICIQYRRKDETVLLILADTASSRREDRESMNAGLNACRRILRIPGGSFEANEAGVFYGGASGPRFG